MAGRMLPPVMATLAASDSDFAKTLDDADARMVVTAGLMDDLGRNRNIGMDTSSTGSDLRTLGDDADATAKDIDKIKPATDNAGGGLDNLKKKADSASNSLGGSGGGGGLLAALMPLAAAILPIAGVATGAAIALAGMATAGIAGIGAFALAAGPQLTTMKTEMGGLLQSFQAVNAPTVLPVLNNAVGLFGTALQAANPLVGATSNALLNLEGRAKSALQSPAWTQFTTYIDASAGPAINTFGTVLGNLGHGFGNLLIAFAPVETQMEQGLVHLSQGFLNWTSSTGGVHSFVTFFQAEGPQVAQLIGNLGRIVTDLLPAFTGWGTILIKVANPLLSIVNDLEKVNPAVADVTAALVIGGLAWSKWGDGISAAFSAVKSFIDGSSPLAVRIAALGSASAASAVPMTDLRVAATGAGSEVAAVGSEAEKAGGLLGGAGVAAGGLGAGLGTIALAAAPVAVVLGGVAASSILTKQYTDQVSASVARMTATMSGAGTGTIPQLNQALSSNKELLATLQKQYIDTAGANEGLSTQTELYIAHAMHSTEQNDAYSQSVKKITDMDVQLQAAQKTQVSNLDLLSSKYGISKDSAASLATTLGLNLNKALSGLQVAQVGAQLQEMASSAGISQAALQNLATTSKTSMTAVSTAITQAEQATQKSFSAAGDLVTAFSGQTAVTGQQIQLFYGSAVSQAQSFTANIRTAIADGYDPTLISQLLQAGPAQAGPLLQSLVDNVSNGMVQTVGAATSALSQLNAQAVQQQRITYEAVTAGSSQMAADVGNAFAIQQQMTIQGASATVASVNQVLGLGVNQVQQISDEYSLGLPNAFQAQQTNAYLMAQAQAQQAAQGVISWLGATQAAAAQHAAALPNNVWSRIGDVFNNASAQGAAVGGGLNSASGGVFGAASALAGGVLRNLSIGDTSGIGVAAAQGIAAGLDAGAGAVNAAAAGIAANVHNTIAAALQVKSPSRVTTEIGQFVGQGLAIGIQSTIPLVHGVASSMASAVAAGLTGATGSFSAPTVPNVLLAASRSVTGTAGVGTVPAVSGIPSSGGGGVVFSGPITITVQGSSDPRATAIAVRNELLQMARTVPNLWSRGG